MKESFVKFLSQENLISTGDSILVAFSGGADSTLLLNLLHEISAVWKLKVSACHVNHHLRETATRDETFCRNFCKERGMDFYLRHVDVKSFAKENRLSLETAARQLRISALEEVRIQTKSDFIATAHHADDQVETVLMRLFKGAGAHGLSGISVKRGAFIRPILFATKAEILEEIENRGLSFVQDESNESDFCERNFIRNELMPRVLKRFPSAGEKILETAAIFSEEEGVWKNLFSDLEEFCSTDENEIWISKEIFLKNPALVRRFLHQKILKFSDFQFYLNRELFQKTASFSSQDQGNKEIFSGKNLRILSSYGEILVQKARKNFPKDPKHVTITQSDGETWGKTSFYFQKTFAPSETLMKSSRFVCYLPYAEELVLFGIENGQRIAVTGGSKKISDLFCDEKIPLSDREESLSFLIQGKIAAVFVKNWGFRVSKDFYLKEGQKAVRISIKKNAEET